ncbi:hypothetical protein [Teichococcus aestuarii]|uniref:hypothetical protein n=1 Tax=Teichococcus aestuarii TaxID=568898 RepID=UPI0036204263
MALEALLRREGLSPLRDPSNADPRFTRVALRAALADPDGTGTRVAALAGAAAAFARRRAQQEAAVAERLAGALHLAPEGWARLDAAALGRDAVAASALAALLRLLSGAEHAPASAAVRALLSRGQGTLHGVLWSDGVLCREPAACAPPVPAAPGAMWDDRWRLRAGRRRRQRRGCGSVRWAGQGRRPCRALCGVACRRGCWPGCRRCGGAGRRSRSRRSASDGRWLPILLPLAGRCAPINNVCAR